MRRKNRKNDNNIVILGAGILAIVILSAAFYFFYWIRTPIYSVKQAVNAYRKHDVATFVHHVDMDTLYSKACDDIITITAQLNGLPVSKSLVSAYTPQAIKQPFIELLKDITISDIRGETNNSANGSRSSSSDEAKELYSAIDSIANLKSCTFKGASLVRKDNTYCIVAIVLYNSELKKQFNLNARMEKLDDGKWRIKEITNLNDCILELAKARISNAVW